ncbi:hypothetical protein BBJ28_00009907 [Nothophytophthora sp. Chile5]|nr:hypothetical protein BBJ28_00009907 [Nothophytophthora sp. Chile5]
MLLSFRYDRPSYWNPGFNNAKNVNVGVMVVVRSSTRVEEEGKEAAVVVPAEVQEAIAMVESDSPLVAAEGFSKLSHATFNNREFALL